MADLRRVRYAVSRRCVRSGGFFLTGFAALSLSAVPLPAPARAGLHGSGRSVDGERIDPELTWTA
jgi:hypothetical protein